MITTVVSTILGLVGGLLPDIMKEVRDSRNAVREREFLKLQAELQIQQIKATGDAKLREIEAGAAAEEARAMREHLTALWESESKPTGIVWLDAFNRSLRPTFISTCMLMFAAAAIPFMISVLADHAAGSLTATQMADVIRASIFGEGILGSIFYLLGYRTSGALPRPR